MSENEQTQETALKAAEPENQILTNKELSEKYGLPEFDGSMSIEQYAKLVQHALIAKAMKPEVLYAEAYAKAYHEKNGGEYKFPTTPVSESDKENALKSVNKNVDIVSAAVQSAVQDYNKAGKELPSDNNKAYKKAVKKIYTVNVDSNQLKGFGNISIRDELISDNELPLQIGITVSAENTAENTAKARQQDTSENASSPAAKESAQPETTAAAAGSNSSSELKNTMTRDNSAAHSGSSNSSDAYMTRMINYMNRMNGKGKEVDAASTVAKLKEKYGDKAEEFLVMAITEPANYAKYTGNASVKTSRAALENLANSNNPQELQKKLLGKKDGQNTQTDDKSPLLAQMQEDSTNAWINGKKLIEALEKQNEAIKGALKSPKQEEIVVPYAPDKQQGQNTATPQNRQNSSSGQQTQQSNGTPYAPQKTQPSWTPVWQKRGGRE